MRRLKALGYRFSRWLIGKIARPQVAGIEEDDATLEASREEHVYVMDSRSLSDLVIVDLTCEKLGLPRPLDPIVIGDHTEERRFFFLNRPAGGPFRKNTMQTVSDRMVRILSELTSSVPPY